MKVTLKCSTLSVYHYLQASKILSSLCWRVHRTVVNEFDCFTIAGDFNIHIDNAEMKTSKEMITVLNTFDLIQHVHGPTHNRGHTLDLLISRGLNISSIVIKDVALSNHFCIFFDILISVNTESRSVSVRKRNINENTRALFMKAISLTPSISADSVDLLLDSLTQKLRRLLMILPPWNSARRMADKNHVGENQQQFRIWKDNAERLSGWGGRWKSKFTIASIKTAFMLSM